VNLEKAIVLRLNSGWIPCGISTIRDAITAMNSGDDFIKAAIGVDMQFQQNEDGSWNFDIVNSVPTTWDKWVNLPIRPFDLVVNTAKQRLRVPTVIIAQNYVKVPHRFKKPTSHNIRERDGNMCQITGEILAPGEGNLDHTQPRSRGGDNSWENLAYMKKELNTRKGDRTLEEMQALYPNENWTLLKELKAPPMVPASASIRELKHRDWKMFLKYLE
jgi:5-methylcytosine-specific restriction endonuclease McrA